MKNRSFSRCERRRTDHKMEENLRRLSHCLNQASEVVQQLASATSNSASNSAQTIVSTSGGMTSVSQAVGRARAMMHQSSSRGLYSRLCTSQIEASTSPPGICIFCKIFVQIPPSRGRKVVQMPHHRSIPGDQMPPPPGNLSVAFIMLRKLCM